MYIIIWEFHPRIGSEKEFEDVYGPDGTWATFFKNGVGYLRTELLQDTSNPHRYMTLDYWTSQQAYETFLKQHADKYKAIDLKCESLTAHEIHIGSFTIM